MRSGARACGIVALALLALLARPGTTIAAETFYSPVANGIDAVCDAYRPRAKRENVVRLARIGGSDAAWMATDEATNARIQSAPTFGTGDFATVVLENGAIVSADSAHVDGPAGRVVEHAWCFIGGKLSRATVDVASTFDRGSGYRRTRYYGDDLDQPLAEFVSERGAVGKAFVPPPKEIDALLVTEPDARPVNLPFYDAFALERKHALPLLRAP